MTVERLSNCFDEGGKLERPRYFDHQLLRAEDLLAEQEYFRRRMMRHNRFLHGWGVVCGLQASADPTDELPWRLRIDPGYALDPFGHEIQVPAATYLDLALCGPGATSDPCDPALLRTPAPAAGGGEVFVAIRYAECVSRPVRVLPDGCACVEESCEFSRVRGSFEIACLAELPPSHEPSAGPLLCDILEGRALPACPPCPDDPWVVLARVSLPAATVIAVADVDNFSFRRQVFSTAVLQNQLIACCCADRSADLEISKRVSSHGIVEAEGNVQYTVELKNLGPSDAQNVKVQDNLNIQGIGLILEGFKGFLPVDVSWSSQVNNDASGVVEATISTLRADESITLTFTAVIGGLDATFSNFTTLVASNTVEVSSDTPDPNSANNVATITFSPTDS